MTRPLVITALVALTLAGTACHRSSSASSNYERMPTAFDHQESRQSYVDGHYKKYLEGGRAPDEKAARAMAGLEWDTHARRNNDRNNETVRWSTADRAKAEQRAFEGKLRELGY